jgi:hypothetical protein
VPSWKARTTTTEKATYRFGAGLPGRRKKGEEKKGDGPGRRGRSWAAGREGKKREAWLEGLGFDFENPFLFSLIFKTVLVFENKTKPFLKL